MLHTERLLLVGLNPGSSWCETKPNKQTKKQQQKGTVPITPSAIQTCRISPHNLQTRGV